MRPLSASVGRWRCREVEVGQDAVFEVPTSTAEFRCNEMVRNIDDFNATCDVNPGDELWLDEAELVSIG